MVDDPIKLLERELVKAAERRTAPAGRRRARAGVRRRLPRIGPIAAVAAALIPVLAVVGVVVVIRGHSQGLKAARPAAPGPSLASILGVLRRPQPLRLPDRGDTVAVARAVHSRNPADSFNSGRLRRVEVQLANASGEQRYQGVALAPVRTRTGERLAVSTLDERAQIVRQLGNNGSCLCPTRSPVYFGPYVPAQQIAARGAVSLLSANPGTGTEAVVVVPYGVSRVGLASDGRRTVISDVHDNLAGFQVPFSSSAGYTLIWYGPGGRVIRRMPGPVPPELQSDTPRETRALVSMLGVLRTAQTGVTASMLRELGADPALGRVGLVLDRALVRRVRVALPRPGDPGAGREIELEVVHTSAIGAAPSVRVVELPARPGGRGLVSDLAGLGFADATTLTTSGLAELIGEEQGGRVADVAVVVPDGVPPSVGATPVPVARVGFQLQHGPTEYASVHGNIAAFRVPFDHRAPVVLSLSFYGPNGTFLHSVGETRSKLQGHLGG